MTDVLLHVGHDPAATKARFLEAIRRAEAGAATREQHITFETWDGLAKVLSGKRLELLRHVYQHPAASVAELGRALGRDYKRVHEDVEILTVAGLLERTEGGVRAAYDEIRTVISLKPAA
ncbi:HVO_A0114 family putative DNA-binding protein [Methylobacterium brachiatum]|jgi:predicted transcriptional regulator